MESVKISYQLVRLDPRYDLVKLHLEIFFWTIVILKTVYLEFTMRVLVAVCSDSFRAHYWSSGCCAIDWDQLSAVFGCLAWWVWTLWTAVNIYWLVTLAKGADSPGDHQEVHWYPLEKPYTPIHRNAKNTQYSGFVNNLIGISTRVGGTSMWTR